MPVLARIFEESGLSTIFVTNMPFWAEKVGVPRTLAVEFPFGHILGDPGNSKQQVELIKEALLVLETADSPGKVIHSEAVWHEEGINAINLWQPKEASPVISMMSGELRKLIKKSRE